MIALTIAALMFDKQAKKKDLISSRLLRHFAPTTPYIKGMAIESLQGKSPRENEDSVKEQRDLHLVDNMKSLTETELERARYYFSQRDWARTIAACQKTVEISPQTAEAYKIWGNALQKQGKISEAIGYYAKTLEIQPDTPEIYINLGSIYARKKQWQKAIEYFQQAIDLNPLFDGAYRNLARVWTELGEQDKAIEATYHAHAAAPAKITAAEHYLLGRKLLNLQLLDEALECYRWAIELQPDWLEVYEHLANLLEKLGLWEESVICRRQIIDLQRKQGKNGKIVLLTPQNREIVATKPNPKPAIDIIKVYLEQLEDNPDCAETNALVGSLFEQRQKWKEAVFFYRQSIKLNPQQPHIYARIAQSLLKIGKEDVAADCWYRALTLQDKEANPTEYLRLGNLYQKLNKLDAAALCYRQAIKLQATSIEAYDRLVEILCQQGKVDRAIEVYQIAIKYNPKNYRPFYHLGKIFASGNSWDSAIACYQKALAVDAKSWQVYHELGDAFSQKQAWQDAANSYRSSIALKDDFFWSYNNLGYVLLHLQAATEAIEVLRKALKLKQDFHWTYDNLGAAYLSLQRWDEAAAAYSRVLKLQPQSTQARERLDYALEQKAANDNNLALQLYLEAIECDPDDLDSYLEAIAIQDDRPELYIGLADVYCRRQQWQEALINYQKAARLNPNDEAIAAKIEAIQLKLTSLDADISLTEDNTVLVSVREKKDLIDTTDKATAFPLKEDLWLCFYPLGDNASTSQLASLASVEAIDRLGKKWLLTVTNNNNLEIALDIQEKLASFLPQASKAIFNLLQVAYNKYPQIGDSETIVRLYPQINQNLTSSQLRLDRGYWFAPSLFYLEATVNGTWVTGDITIFAFSADNWGVGKARAFQINENTVGIFTLFDTEIYHSPHAAYSLTIDTGVKILTIDGEIFAKAYSLEFFQAFNQKPEHQKHLIRESIAQTIIQQSDRHCLEDRANLIQKFQYFSRIEQLYPNNPDVPFQIFFDRIISIKNDGLFISGWLQDPYNLLESIEAISDLGVSLTIDRENIYKFERQDVSEYLKTTPYGNFEDKYGFCTYIAVPAEIQQQLLEFAEIHSFRFCIHLKGRIYLDYVPPKQHQDIYNSRQTILHIASPDKIDEAMLLNCIAPAAAKLNQYCIEAAAIREVKTFGNPLSHPLISIIIPLYKCLDFLKVQFATMANDPSLRDNCELIYVLDSPEQEKEVTEFLQHHCLLYRLPVTLIVMAHNSGYAAANNHGASLARGRYLILMNSDVFPQKAGWAMQMADFYAANPEIGTLAPKLLYEDDSLQHAGMYFTKTTYPFWLTLHHYKGFPHSYPAACISRRVTAVTGACLFVAKELFDRVGGITTDYIIGDFEDSDFCFKCASLGYQSWYFADTELYHLERQSVPLNSVYAHSLAWQYNARLHDDRWGAKEFLAQ